MNEHGCIESDGNGGCLKSVINLRVSYPLSEKILRQLQLFLVRSARCSVLVNRQEFH